MKTQIKSVDYGTFLDMLDEKNVKEVEIEDEQIVFTDNADPTGYYTTVGWTTRNWLTGCTIPVPPSPPSPPRNAPRC